MGIIVGDNFNYQSTKPLDSRAQFASLADMKAYPDASLYDGCIAYVTANKKNYQYDSNNTIDLDTGKWRELTTGGGGGGSVPAGGTTGQALLKKSNADEDVEWGNIVDANAYSINDGLENALDTGDKIPYYNVSTQEKHNVTWDNLKASLKTYFDTLYSKLTRQTPTSGGTTLSAVYTGDMYNWNAVSTYGTCSTSASTTSKSVSITRGTFTFTAGAKIAVKFSYSNTASAPTLTVNSTTKNIKCIDEDGNTYTPSIWWNANDIVEFVYDGTQFLMQPTTGMMFKIHGTTIPRESIYSTTEKVVGCWTDGRPIYQKTFIDTMPSYTAPSGSSTPAQALKDIAIGASVLTCISVEGTVVGSSGTICDLPALPNGLPSVVTSKVVDAVRLVIRTNSATTSPNTIGISSTYANYNGCAVRITLKYTKTTDSANSFKYADPNDYSTSEKIIGSWIDGKPLYQKTISCGALPNATTKTVAHGISGTYSIKSIQGYANYSTDTMPLPHTGVGDAAGANAISVAISGSNIVVKTGSDRSNYSAYITIKYTKT